MTSLSLLAGRTVNTCTGKLWVMLVLVFVLLIFVPFYFPNMYQGSHELWKSWKTWKITQKSSMHGNIMRFEKKT